MHSKRFFAVGAASALLLTALTGSADAQGRGRGQDKGKAQAQSQAKDKAKDKAHDKAQDKAKNRGAANPQTVVVFRDSDRVTLRDYFVAQRITAQQLPPGIAMNIARGKPLPPGIAKKIVPAHVIVTGTRADPTVTYYVVGDRVVAVRDGHVIDILLNIFR